MLNDTNLTDMETCYKAFVAERLRAIPLQSERFGIEPEITAKVSLNRLRLYEVPVSYNGRTYEEGKKIGWRDGMAALWWIVRYRFSARYADPGRMALDALEQAPKFNEWMYDSIKSYLGHRLVELGCGRGNLTRHFRHHGELLALDYRDDYLSELREKWGYLSNLELGRMDLVNPDDYERVRRFQPDTVVCLNVLEHIEDDRAVLRQLHRALPDGARLVFLVPYGPALTSEFDRQVGHFRRYDRGELEGKMREAGFAVVRQFFFNKVGVLAWWLGNTLGGQRTIAPWQLRLYNLLTPLFRILDQVLPTTGLSTIVVAHQPANRTAPAQVVSPELTAPARAG
jgi:SAM-dependent methyltransferase